ncbi:hypothetical protein BAE44_0025883, partial [Dichanthelium oligosanthes]
LLLFDVSRSAGGIIKMPWMLQEFKNDVLYPHHLMACASSSNFLEHLLVLTGGLPIAIHGGIDGVSVGGIIKMSWMLQGFKDDVLHPHHLMACASSSSLNS